jgi:hypothetical protein
LKHRFPAARDIEATRHDPTRADRDPVMLEGLLVAIEPEGSGADTRALNVRYLPMAELNQVLGCQASDRGVVDEDRGEIAAGEEAIDQHEWYSALAELFEDLRGILSLLGSDDQSLDPAIHQHPDFVNLLLRAQT